MSNGIRCCRMSMYLHLIFKFFIHIYSALSFLHICLESRIPRTHFFHFWVTTRAVVQGLAVYLPVLILWLSLLTGNYFEIFFIRGCWRDLFRTIYLSFSFLTAVSHCFKISVFFFLNLEMYSANKYRSYHPTWDVLFVYVSSICREYWDDTDFSSSSWRHSFRWLQRAFT